MLPPHVNEEINRLHGMRMTGEISQSEYEKRKKKLLKVHRIDVPQSTQVVQVTSDAHQYVQVVHAKARKKGLGLLLFVVLASWFAAWTMTAGGTKTSVAGSFDISKEALAVLLFFIGLFYMLPAFVAGLRGHPHYLGIVVVNLLLATTGIVWIGCLVWALISPTPAPQTLIVESRSNSAG